MKIFLYFLIHYNIETTSLTLFTGIKNKEQLFGPGTYAGAFAESARIYYDKEI